MNSKDSEKQGGKDIISQLPDDVLIDILSNLETIYAVRTCFLSSVWLNLWRWIYKLDFNCWFRDYDKCAPIINQVLESLQSQKIQSFSIFARLSLRADAHLPNWAAYAAEHNVRELSLDFDCDYIKLPQSVLTCKSLEKLTLKAGYFDFDVPDSLSMCFPSLKSFYFFIFDVGVRDVSQLQNLFNGCPVLEDLTISAKKFNIEPMTFYLTLPCLKTLSIHEDKASYNVGFGAPDEFVVEAHNLEELDISVGETFPYVVLDDAPNLQKVSLAAKISNFAAFVSLIQCDKTMELLCGIRYTRCLSLLTGAIRVLSFALVGNMPTFPNLINLELEMESYDCVQLLCHFLMNSPNLQSLTLKLGASYFYYTPAADDLLGPMHFDFISFDEESLPSCLLSFVKRIQIKPVCNIRELGAIKYLLEHGKVLESFSVGIHAPKSELEVFQNRILDFPKASTLYEIEFLC